jgi:hypothetical protein
LAAAGSCSEFCHLNLDAESVNRFPIDFTAQIFFLILIVIRAFFIWLRRELRGAFRCLNIFLGGYWGKPNSLAQFQPE